MKKAFLLSLTLVVAAFLASAFRADVNPSDVLKQITEMRTQKIAAARDAKQTADFGAIQAEAEKMAKDAVKGVDPNMVPAAQGYEWAQLFQTAGQTKDACDAAGRYLSSNPGPQEKYRAQMLQLQCCNSLGEGHMVNMLVGQIQPPDPISSANFLRSTAALYADTIRKTEGLNAALAALDAAERKVDFDKVKAFYQEQSDKMKAQNPNAAGVDPLVQVETLKAAIGQAKAELYTSEGKEAEALKAIDAALAGIRPESTAARSLKSSKTRMVIVGKTAPNIVAERAYGTYTNLASMKGKVVIVDFFAHWCGPCIASFPDMKKMYADLHDKGLEVVAFTTYYGYYKGENTAKRDMPKDTEFAKMGDFMKEYSLPWTVVYGERTNFDAYGITGIPTTALIGKDGVLKSLHVGYSAATFAEFRKEVEKALAEK